MLAWDKDKDGNKVHHLLMAVPLRGGGVEGRPKKTFKTVFFNKEKQFERPLSLGAGKPKALMACYGMAASLRRPPA